MSDVHVYVNKPAGKDVPSLEDVGETVRRLSFVSGVEADPSGSVIGVSFEGGRAEREEIEHAIEETGYEISRLSVRSTFQRED
jgi:copper chaperone CopZ